VVIKEKIKKKKKKEINASKIYNPSGKFAKRGKQEIQHSETPHSQHNWCSVTTNSASCKLILSITEAYGTGTREVKTYLLET